MVLFLFNALATMPCDFFMVSRRYHPPWTGPTTLPLHIALIILPSFISSSSRVWWARNILPSNKKAIESTSSFLVWWRLFALIRHLMRFGGGGCRWNRCNAALNQIGVEGWFQFTRMLEKTNFFIFSLFVHKINRFIPIEPLIHYFV